MYRCARDALKRFYCHLQVMIDIICGWDCCFFTCGRRPLDRSTEVKRECGLSIEGGGGVETAAGVVVDMFPRPSSPAMQ